MNAHLEYVDAHGVAHDDVFPEDQLRTEIVINGAVYGILDCYVTLAYTVAVYGHIEAAP